MTTGDKHPENTAKIRWGAHFKATREALHLSEKDAATRLHLNPNMITLIENENFKNDTPTIFMRGYIRSYGRLLNISDKHINQALADLGFADQSTVKATPLRTKKVMETPTGSSFTTVSTSIVVLVLAGLVGMWWNTHNRNTTDSTGSTNTLTMQSNPASGNGTAPNTATPTDPTPKELVAAQPPADTTTTAAGTTTTTTPNDATANTVTADGQKTDTAPTAPNPNVAPPIAENNPADTGATPPNPQNFAAPGTNPMADANAPTFDLPNDANEMAPPAPTTAASVADNNGTTPDAIDPNKPVVEATKAPTAKRHMAKIHHKRELNDDNMAFPEPGLLPEPGMDMDSNEPN
jgi:cytoskeleton protein RodZ